MPELDIATAETEKDLMAFITFPWAVYRGDPHWVPPLISERRSFLNPEVNPFFEHARAQFFLARRAGQVVGTIGAFTNSRFNEFQGVNVGFFGFFEVLDDPEAAAALLSRAEQWARDAGHESLLGPAQFSTNDEVGLLVDGFGDPPRILMTYNPPRYREYLERAGFAKAMDLWAYALDLDDFIRNLPEKLVRVVDKVRQRGKFHLRRLDLKRFDHEVEQIKRVYNHSWEKNWGFVPFTDREIDRMAEQMRPILDPDLVLLVEQDGEAIAFGLSLPDLSQPLRLAYPRPGRAEWLTMLKLAWHWKVRKSVTWFRVLALGVLPEFRGAGVDAMLYIETARAAHLKGYRRVEMSWILENNEIMNRTIEFLGGKVYKTYRMVEKRL